MTAIGRALRRVGKASPEAVPGRPGVLRARKDVAVPSGYAVFDCETTGLDPVHDEIVSFALVVLAADGAEKRRLASRVHPAGHIPAAASAVHGIYDADVARAPSFAEVAEQLRAALQQHVFVAHNASFDLAMLRHAFEQVGIDYHPSCVACTLDAFRVLEPLAEGHRLEEICGRHAIRLDDAHDALSDVLATADVLRLLLARGVAPESAQLDLDAFMRLRARGDTRPASEPQIRRVFGLARAAGLTDGDGKADRAAVCALVRRVTGTADPDDLTRAEVQDVYDELERLGVCSSTQAAQTA